MNEITEAGVPTKLQYVEGFIKHMIHWPHSLSQ